MKQNPKTALRAILRSTKSFLEDPDFRELEALLASISSLARSALRSLPKEPTRVERCAEFRMKDSGKLWVVPCLGHSDARLYLHICVADDRHEAEEKADESWPDDREMGSAMRLSEWLSASRRLALSDLAQAVDGWWKIEPLPTEQAQVE